MKSQRGLSLIEVLVAMSIFCIGILGMLAMYGRTIGNYSDAKYRADAALLADAILGDMWVNRTSVASYAYAGIGSNPTLSPWLSQVAASLPQGAATVSVSGDPAAGGALVTVSLTWHPPDGSTVGSHVHVQTATIVNP
jgi:type IV pilus assembly protein PilV